MFGVHSAMPSSVARRLCPDAVFLDGRFHRYVEESRRLHAILRVVTPLVEGISLDEAFLDVTGCASSCSGAGRPSPHAIRRRVSDELHLDCSVGVGRCKLMAKLASKAAKPSAAAIGDRTRPRGGGGGRPSDELDVPPSRCRCGPCGGSGPVTGRRLEALGMTDGGRPGLAPAGVARALPRAAPGRPPGRAVPGHDHRPVVPEQEAKSIGHEETFASDIWDRDELHGHLQRMVDASATGPAQARAGRPHRHHQAPVRRLHPDHPLPHPGRPDRRHPGHRRGGRRPARSGRPGPGGPPARGQPVRTRSSRRVGHQLSLDLGSSDPADPGRRGPGGDGRGRRCRGLPPDRRPVAPGAGGRPSASRSRGAPVTAAVDAIRARYGGSSVGPASLVRPDGLRVRRRGEAQWGPAGRAESRSDAGRGRRMAAPGRID